MVIYRSIKRNLLTQGFGKENTASNMMNMYQKMGLEGHNGLDFGCVGGVPVYFDVDSQGEVIETHTDRAGGLGAKVITHDGNKTYKHMYWHLKGFDVKPGDKLDTGDLIGWADNTGRSTGPHLHRGLKIVEKTNTGWQNVNEDNGYFGAIDPTPFFKNVFVKKEMSRLKRVVSILKKMVETYKKILEVKRLM